MDHGTVSSDSNEYVDPKTNDLRNVIHSLNNGLQLPCNSDTEFDILLPEFHHSSHS